MSVPPTCAVAPFQLVLYPQYVEWLPDTHRGRIPFRSALEIYDYLRSTPWDGCRLYLRMDRDSPRHRSWDIYREEDETYGRQLVGRLHFYDVALLPGVARSAA